MLSSGNKNQGQKGPIPCSRWKQAIGQHTIPSAIASGAVLVNQALSLLPRVVVHIVGYNAKYNRSTASINSRYVFVNFIRTIPKV